MGLIDADALKKALREEEKDVCADYGPDHGCEWGFSQDKLESIIDRQPAADAPPPRSGRWVKRKEDALIHWDCSECGIGFLDDTGLDKLRYCPHCGAKMDGINEKEESNHE